MSQPALSNLPSTQQDIRLTARTSFVIHPNFAVTMRLLVLGAALLLPAVSSALSWTATPFSPPSYPLAVRSPYLSAWLPQGSGTALNGAWPQFWTGSTLGWAGFVNVDGSSYSFLGDPAVSGATFSKATQKSAEFTSTQSTFVLTAGGIDLTVTFLSPVEPSDLLNQSIPFSYLALSAASNDGSSHSVSVYSDISAEWVTGDDSLTANWSTTTGDTIFHQVQLEDQTEFGEINDHTQQGSAYYATLNTNGVTHQTGQDIVVRAQFINKGVLANSQDTSFRAVSDEWPVFALAHDLGTVSGTSATVVYAIGHVRDPAIQYIIADNQIQQRNLYFWSRFSSVTDVLSTFLGDYENALARANAFDAQISSDASSISSDYAEWVALSVRQAFGAIEFTISKDSSGNFNTSDILTFMKEISSDGNVNTVDVIYPSWPIFLYTNPAIGKYLLLPLFEYQATGQYPNGWSVHDMGAHYPNATGHNDGNDEPMPLEESGNMLIMTLSYVQAASDTSLITSYYKLLDQWTQYLIQEALIPANQISTDDFAGSLANQTNLAIKGIIGIRAMAELANLVGNSDESSNYTSIASSYVTQWQGFATSSDGKHLTLNYNNDSSWGLTYNMWADKLLKLNLIPESVYEMQTAWYTTVEAQYGVPLDTRHTYTKTDWQTYTAGIVTDTTVRDTFISALNAYAADGENNAPLSDLYYTTNGEVYQFRARPVVGGHFALLALQAAESSA
ncbi:DUF1793-domain-containing protein [Rhodofomes roseus]|uniref:DUF1793-domain-containing protein n=1 Tax=Rhodofomes roseus TaxID=34475 RepID=A0ABQ8KY51_9APHY|nr:DUF1793-domain-containing protein [Rhodofomes roseus]KAH9844227.1 DUF1793-domain-containing protein [Rhodofomes roseus]